VKFSSNSVSFRLYTNPNSNPKTITTLNLTLTDSHDAFESFYEPVFCDYIRQRRQSDLKSRAEVVDPGQKILIFPENLGKILIFTGNLTNKKSIFSANFRKISIFYRYFHKNFLFFKTNSGRISIF